MKQLPYACLFLLLLQPCFAQNPSGSPKLLVIGVDGMGGYGVKHSKTPILDSIMEVGAYTLQAQAVMPTKSSPNWASMIMGAKPEHHGIYSNKWQREKSDHELPCTGFDDDLFPTVFGLMRQQMPDAKIAVFYDWKGFGRLLEAKACTTLEHTEDEDKTVNRAMEYITQNPDFDFIFLHLDHVDHKLHFRGHGKRAYRKAVTKADRLIGKLLATLKKNGLLEETTILITADHGGKRHSHGGDSVTEVEIPWIITGANCRENHKIAQTVMMYDTAATIAHLFGLQVPDCWIGKPVLEVFE